MQTIFDNIIYIQKTKYSAKVGTGNGTQYNGINNASEVGEKLVINDTIVINGRRLTVKVLDDFCFGNLAIKEAVIPDTITEIKKGTFWCCKLLEKVTFLPGSRVESLDFKFLDTTNVAKITLPGTIKHIGDGFVYNINVDIEIIYCGTTVFNSDKLFQRMHTNAKVIVHDGYKSSKFGNVTVEVSNDIICPSVVYQDKYTRKCTCARKQQLQRYLFILIFVVR